MPAFWKWMQKVSNRNAPWLAGFPRPPNAEMKSFQEIGAGVVSVTDSLKGRAAGSRTNQARSMSRGESASVVSSMLIVARKQHVVGNANDGSVAEHDLAILGTNSVANAHEAPPSSTPSARDSPRREASGTAGAFRLRQSVPAASRRREGFVSAGVRGVERL